MRKIHHLGGSLLELKVQSGYLMSGQQFYFKGIRTRMSAFCLRRLNAVSKKDYGREYSSALFARSIMAVDVDATGKHPA